MEKALIGAGCFWGIEKFYSEITGVIDTKVGYSGGNTNNPTYQDVCSGETNHAEVVLINYDESIISYEEIIKYFWECHDPTQLNQQGHDVGTQYRSVIYYFNDNQKLIADKSKEECQSTFEKRIVTEISPADIFYKADEYHQKYIQKSKN